MHRVERAYFRNASADLESRHANSVVNRPIRWRATSPHGTQNPRTIACNLSNPPNSLIPHAQPPSIHTSTPVQARPPLRLPIRGLLLLLIRRNIKLEMHDISTLHDVVSSFDSISTRGFDGGHGFGAVGEGFEVVEGYDFGFDETAFEVGVDALCGTGGVSGEGRGGGGKRLTPAASGAVAPP